MSEEEEFYSFLEKCVYSLKNLSKQQRLEIENLCTMIYCLHEEGLMTKTLTEQLSYVTGRYVEIFEKKK